LGIEVVCKRDLVEENYLQEDETYFSAHLEYRPAKKKPMRKRENINPINPRIRMTNHRS
jgi:hypothetical protein